MKLPVIKKLVETYTLEELQQAELSIAEGCDPAIPVEGEDEGEKLTHAYAAVEVKREILNGKELRVALREFAERVRGTLS